MTRLLLVGAGLIGARHMTHILEHPDLTLAGVVDPVARIPEGVLRFADLQSVDVAVEGVILATPTATHAPLTLEALNRGWPVLVEKPLADSLAAADRMIAASEAKSLPVLVGHHRRHHPLVAQLAEALAEGAIGQPLVATLLWCMKKPEAYFDAPWRQGAEGGPVLQNLIHDVDLLRALFGEVTSVQGSGSNRVRGAARTESGGALLTFDSGVIVTLAFSDAAPTPWGFEAGTGENPNIATTGQNALWIAGTEGGLAFPSMALWRGAASWAEAPERRVIPPAAGDAPLVRQLDHFAEVIAGRAPPLIDATSARATLAATLEIEAQCWPH